jgi:hypothetical protein
VIGSEPAEPACASGRRLRRRPTQGRPAAKCNFENGSYSTPIWFAMCETRLDGSLASHWLQFRQRTLPWKCVFLGFLQVSAFSPDDPVNALADIWVSPSKNFNVGRQFSSFVRELPLNNIQFKG